MPRKKKKEKREAVPFEIDPKKLKEFLEREPTQAPGGTSHADNCASRVHVCCVPDTRGGVILENCDCFCHKPLK